MRKKLLSLLLAAVMLLSFSISALAYEDLTPPLWQRWGYDSLEAYLADWEETEEEYAAEVAEILAERAEQDAFIATYDPETHDFTPALWEYYEYASKEEMLEVWEIDESGYTQAVDDELFSYESRDWTDEQWDAWYEEQWAEELRAEKEALGLVYDLNIMADGAVLSFFEAEPVIRNSCTMAPLGVIAQALHAQADWDGDTGAITIRRGHTVVELKVDDMILSFRTEGPDDNASGGVFYLDSLPYVENDEVYIPVRAVAEALGYEVEWSDTYRTAVLLDVDAAVADFDRSFTVMNAVMAMNREMDRRQTYQGTSRLDIRVSVPAQGGGASFPGSVSAVVVQNGHAAQGAVRYDMKELLSVIALLAADGEAVEDSAELAALADAMDDGIELIFNLDSGMLYLRGKLFGLLTGQEDAAADTWYSMDLNEYMTGVAELSALGQEPVTFGRLICIIAAQSGEDPVYLQDTLDEMAELFSAVEDSRFTGDGSVRRLVCALADDGSCTLALDVTLDGDRATSLAGSVRYNADGTSLDCSFAFSGQTVALNGSYTVEDTLKVDFTMTSDSVPAPDAAIAAAPPAGAPVLDLLELLQNSITVEMERPEDLPAEAE